MKGPRLVGTRNINKNRHTFSHKVWDFIQIIVDIIGMGFILAVFVLILYNLCIPWKPQYERFLPCDPSPCGEAACVAHKNNSFTCVPEPNYKFLKDKGWTVPMCETDNDCETGDGFVCHDGGCECPPHLTHEYGMCIRANCVQKLLQSSCIRPDNYKALPIFTRLAQQGKLNITTACEKKKNADKSSFPYQLEVEEHLNCISKELRLDDNKMYLDEILNCSEDCAVWVHQAFGDSGSRGWNETGTNLSNSKHLPDVLNQNELVGALAAIHCYGPISKNVCTAGMQLVKFECGTRVFNKLKGGESSTIKNETMAFARGYWSALMLSTGSRECNGTLTADILDRFLHYCFQAA